MNNIYVFIASGFYVGFVPFAPGTLASVVALLVAYYVPYVWLVGLFFWPV